MEIKRVIVIVLDSVGIGELPDAADFGDVGSHTLGNMARVVGGLKVPNMEKMGLGNIAILDGVVPQEKPTAVFGKLGQGWGKVGAMQIRILFLCFLMVGLFGCADAEGFVADGLEPELSLEEIGTATIAPPSETNTIEPTITSTRPPEVENRVEVSVGVANLRNGAGTDSAIVGVVSAGQVLALLESSADGQWYRIETADGLVGWVGSSVARLIDVEVARAEEIEVESEGVTETATVVVEGGSSEAAGLSGETAVVTYVHDGDTIVVEIDGVEERVRYIGINTPELDEACGTEASRANRRLVDGKTVRLVKDVSERDGSGRLLRYVYVGNTFVNAELVKEGWAFPISYAPDTEMDGVLVDARIGAPRRDCQTSGVAAPTEEPPAAAAPPAPAAPAATEPPQQQPAPTEPPAPTGPPAGVPGFCTCTGADLNCPAFSTHNEAQSCHDYCMGLGYGDIYGLDGHNNNGLACESLP